MSKGGFPEGSGRIFPERIGRVIPDRSDCVFAEGGGCLPPGGFKGGTSPA